jgi:hypothetical protein
MEFGALQRTKADGHTGFWFLQRTGTTGPPSLKPYKWEPEVLYRVK